MVSRQSGHFFFGPRGYDHVNEATHDHKEEIKVGYNLRRKVVLVSIWALSPVVVYFDRSVFGLLEAGDGFGDYLHNVGLVWIATGLGGLLFRVSHLIFIKDVMTGLGWMFKIITDLKINRPVPIQLSARPSVRR